MGIPRKGTEIFQVKTGGINILADSRSSGDTMLTPG
jgi:hypothetical protein